MRHSLMTSVTNWGLTHSIPVDIKPRLDDPHNLPLPPGIFAVAGAPETGKTTLMRAMAIKHKAVFLSFGEPEASPVLLDLLTLDITQADKWPTIEFYFASDGGITSGELGDLDSSPSMVASYSLDLSKTDDEAHVDHVWFLAIQSRNIRLLAWALILTAMRATDRDIYVDSFRMLYFLVDPGSPTGKGGTDPAFLTSLSHASSIFAELGRRIFIVMNPSDDEERSYNYMRSMLNGSLTGLIETQVSGPAVGQCRELAGGRSNFTVDRSGTINLQGISVVEPNPSTETHLHPLEDQ